MTFRPRMRLDRDLVAEIAHQGLAGQVVLPVDAHGIRAAHAVRARTAERKRPVVMAFDVFEQVQDAFVLVGLHRIGLVMAALVFFRVVAENFNCDFHHRLY